jgi:hypothetical protein
LPNGVLDGAAGAFSAQTGKIYLSESVVNGDPALLRAVLLEEVGHYLDSVVNAQDTPGDEGELFSALVRGIELSHGELDRLKTENDQTNIFLNGYSLSIEQANVNWNNSSGGSFTNPTNWTSGVVPGVNDKAVFNLSSSGYSIYT